MRGLRHLRTGISRRLFGASAVIAMLAALLISPTAHAQSEIVITPEEDLAAIVAGAGAGATFVLAPGVHNTGSLIPMSGQSFIGGQDVVMDGGGVHPYAIRNFNGATDITIRDIEFTGYVGGSGLGVIHARPSGYPYITDPGYEDAIWVEPLNWNIERVFVHDNDSIGIEISSGSTIVDSVIHRNAWGGIRADLANNVTIRGGRVSENAQAAFDEGGLMNFAAGIKVTVSRQVLVEDVWVHRNIGRGIWYDLSARLGVARDNVVTENAGTGIYYEISYDGLIEDNVVLDNAADPAFQIGWMADGGISAGTSSRVTVRRNLVRNSPNGVAVFDVSAAREGMWEQLPTRIRLEPFNAENFTAEDNVICDAVRSGMAVLANAPMPGMYETAQWSRNTYINTTHVGLEIWQAPFDDWQALGYDIDGAAGGTCPLPTKVGWGDVNCDGQIDLLDALFISQNTVGLRSESAGCSFFDSGTQIDLVEGDMNLDGAIDLLDALLISQCHTGLRDDVCVTT